jgi:hypothetical protein
MNTDEKKFCTPVPWDNLPRQFEAYPRRPSPGPAKPGIFGNRLSPQPSNAHLFYPFQAIPSNPEEEK